MNPEIQTLISLFAIAHPIVGYWLLRFKHYRGWWYVMLLICLTPLFWLTVGCMTSKNKEVDTGWASVCAVLFGALNLLMILYLSNAPVK